MDWSNATFHGLLNKVLAFTNKTSLRFAPVHVIWSKPTRSNVAFGRIQRSVEKDIEMGQFEFVVF